MKIPFFIIVIILLSCCKHQSENKKEILNAFGKAKLDMSISEFNKVFKNDSVIKEEPFNKTGAAHFKCVKLKINDTISVENDHFHFRKYKLACIGSRSSETFYKYLKNKYGIKSEVDHGVVKIINFNTNDVNLVGAIESYTEFSNVAIYRIGYIPNY
jgi:hypothetical protein